MIEEIKGTKEEAVKSVGWLFAGGVDDSEKGNYDGEQKKQLKQIIESFEGFGYLERNHVIEILTYIYKSGTDNKNILNDLFKEHNKQL